MIILAFTFITTSIDIYSYVQYHWQYHWQWMISDNIMVVCIVHLCWCIREPFPELVLFVCILCIIFFI
jgi:hypothetical protein